MEGKSDATAIARSNQRGRRKSVEQIRRTIMFENDTRGAQAGDDGQKSARSENRRHPEVLLNGAVGRRRPALNGSRSRLLDLPPWATDRQICWTDVPRQILRAVQRSIFRQKRHLDGQKFPSASHRP
jgi:hypothetical protein